MHAANDREKNAEELVEAVEDGGRGRQVKRRYVESIGEDGSVKAVEAGTAERLEEGVCRSRGCEKFSVGTHAQKC